VRFVDGRLERVYWIPTGPGFALGGHTGGRITDGPHGSIFHGTALLWSLSSESERSSFSVKREETI
jgi:hypothetical protein